MPKYNRTSRQHRPKRDIGKKREGNRFQIILPLATLTVAISSALVAFFQYSAARRAYSAQSRAFVISNSFQLTNYGGQGPVDAETPRWVINPVIENAGNTPASDLKFSIDIAIGNFASSEMFEQRNPYKLSFNQGLIGPRSQMATGLIIVGPSNLTPLSGRKAPIGALGVIKYKDIFGEPHLTEYCFSAVIPPLDVKDFPKGQPIRLNGAFCEKHNCADAECGADWEQRASE